MFAKAAWQLGLTQVLLNAVYRLGLITGHYQRTIRVPEEIPGLRIKPVFPLPSREQLTYCLGEAGENNLLQEADEIVSGSFRMFGGTPVTINLSPNGPLPHWTKCESHREAQPGEIIPAWYTEDIKFTWEPARFGWAFVLGRAFILTGDEKYAVKFFERLEEFATANPPYMGPNWSSGQEAGLRLMALTWCSQIFTASETVMKNPGKIKMIADLSAVHAARIPGTLVYARSQNNNHLLTEGAALLTAGYCLPEHPQAESWKNTGAKRLTWCFTHQIDEQGEYVQHSANYHRLMLQTALWVFMITGRKNFPGGQNSLQKLEKATRWYINRLDPISGQVPNLGANDGALIMPFSCSDFSDHRPAAKAAARAFLEEELAGSEGEEMSLWYGLKFGLSRISQPYRAAGIIRGSYSWANLRAIHYHNRPSHADHLHLDLWIRGKNIALDAGTYSYNAQPPWDNPLTSTLVHNTICINGSEQMTRAGRFLYTDWGKSNYLSDGNMDSAVTDHCSAQTSAYQRVGVLHQRNVTMLDGERWLVTDHLLRVERGKHSGNSVHRSINSRLHWLLPDLPWKMDSQSNGCELTLSDTFGDITIKIRTDHPVSRTGLVRSGELIKGDALFFPYSGWHSPTYNMKKPALSLSIEVDTAEDLRMESEFSLQVIK